MSQIADSIVSRGLESGFSTDEIAEAIQGVRMEAHQAVQDDVALSENVWQTKDEVDADIQVSLDRLKADSAASIITTSLTDPVAISSFREKLKTENAEFTKQEQAIRDSIAGMASDPRFNLGRDTVRDSYDIGENRLFNYEMRPAPGGKLQAQVVFGKRAGQSATLQDGTKLDTTERATLNLPDVTADEITKMAEERRERADKLYTAAADMEANEFVKTPEKAERLSAESAKLEKEADLLESPEGMTYARKLRVFEELRKPEYERQIGGNDIKDYLEGIPKGLANQGYGIATLATLPFSKGKAEAIREEQRTMNETTGAYGAEFSGGLLAKSAKGGLESIGNMVPALALGVAGAGERLAIASLAPGTWGQEYNENLNKADAFAKAGDLATAKKLRENAVVLASLGTTIELGSEALFPLFSNLGGGSLKGLAKQTGQELVEEGVGKIAREEGVKSFTGEEIDYSDVPEIAGATTVATLGMGLPALLANRFSGQGRQAQVAQEGLPNLQGEVQPPPPPPPLVVATANASAIANTINPGAAPIIAKAAAIAATVKPVAPDITTADAETIKAEVDASLVVPPEKAPTVGELAPIAPIAPIETEAPTIQPPEITPQPASDAPENAAIAPEEDAPAVASTKDQLRTENDAEYEAANQAFKVVSREYTAATKKYRAKEIDDAEFIPVMEKFKAAQSAWDEAESKYIEKFNQIDAMPDAKAENDQAELNLFTEPEEVSPAIMAVEAIAAQEVKQDTEVIAALEAVELAPEATAKVDSVIAESSPMPALGSTVNIRIEGKPLSGKLVATNPDGTFQVQTTEGQTEYVSGSNIRRNNPSPPSPRLYGGFPGLDPALIQRAAVSAYRMAKELGQWSRVMVKRFGDRIRPRLAAIWQDVKKIGDAAWSAVKDEARMMTTNKGAINPSGKKPAGGFLGFRFKSGRTTPLSRAHYVTQDEQLTTETFAKMEASADDWIAKNGTGEIYDVAKKFAEDMPTIPANVQNFIVEKLITRANDEMASADPLKQYMADKAGDYLSGIFQFAIGEEWGRAGAARAEVVKRMGAQMMVLKARGWLKENQDRVIDKAIEGGTKGGAAGVKKIAKDAGDKASETLIDKIKDHTSPALKKLLAQIKDKVTGEMPWRDLFKNLTQESQSERQKEIVRRIFKHENLRDISPGEAAQLASLLDAAWQKERQKVFKEELAKKGLGEKTKEAKKKVEAAVPELLRLMNLGIFSAETFRDAIAEQYGLKTMSPAELSRANKEAQGVQDAVPGSLDYRRKAMKLAKTVSGLAHVPLTRVLASYYVGSILMGLQTAWAALTSIFEAVFQLGIGASVTAAKGNPQIAAQGAWRYIANIPGAVWEGLAHFWNGDRTGTLNANEEITDWMEGQSASPQQMGDQLWKSRNPLNKFMGFVMLFSNRMLTGIDLSTSASLYESMLMFANANTEVLEDGKRNDVSLPTKDDMKMMRDNVLREEFGGVMPNRFIPANEARWRAAMRDQQDRWFPKEVVATAKRQASGPSYQGKVRGVVGHAVNRVTRFFAGGSERVEEFIKNNPKIPDGAKDLARGLAGIMEFGRIISGTIFAPFIGRMINRNLENIPAMGLGPMVYFFGRHLSSFDKSTIRAKNALGLGMVAGALYWLFRPPDEDDWFGIEGDFESLTPQQKSTKRTIGAKQSSFWYKDLNGVKHYISFANTSYTWLFSGLANMKEKQANNPEEFAKMTTAQILSEAVMEGGTSAFNLSAARPLAELLGRDPYNRADLTGKTEGAIEKGIALARGFIPTMARDIDQMLDPNYYKPETIKERAMSVIPFLRRQVNEGQPALGLTGNPAQINRKPWARFFNTGADTPAEIMLGRLADKGLYLSMPNEKTGRKFAIYATVLDSNGNEKKQFVRYGTMTEQQIPRYVRQVGQYYQTWVENNGEGLLKMPREQADEAIQTASDKIKDAAAQIVGENRDLRAK